MGEEEKKKDESIDQVLKEVENSIAKNIPTPDDWLDKVIKLEEIIEDEKVQPYTYKKLSDGSFQILRHGMRLNREYDKTEDDIKKMLATYNDIYKIGYLSCHQDALNIIFAWLDEDENPCDTCDDRDTCDDCNDDED